MLLIIITITIIIIRKVFVSKKTYDIFWYCWLDEGIICFGQRGVLYLTDECANTILPGCFEHSVPKPPAHFLVTRTQTA